MARFDNAVARPAAKKMDTNGDAFLADTLRMAALAAEHKAFDIRAYDVRGLTLIADSFVVCSTSSEPQLKAVHNAVMEGMKEEGVRPLYTEGSLQGGWKVLDYGTVILHIFREEPRAFYDIDSLWSDAPRIPLEDDGGSPAGESAGGAP